jgi:putative ATP-dependent endonuclease of the OLD family
MKLFKLRIRNLRCFKEEIAIDFEDITALIGKNDAGKSTILDALDIFFNDLNPDKDDATKNGNPNDLTIICEFTDLPDEVILDDTNPTNLNTEFLLNTEGRLEIHKSYSGELQSPKCKSIEAYAIHPTIDGVKDLLQLKNPDLKKHASELNVDLSGIDNRINAQIRAKIREHFPNLNTMPIMIPLNQDNAKKIWTELSKYLPAFALFKSDRSSTDQDPEAQDPLKVAVKEAIKTKEEELARITEYVRNEVQKIADLTLEKLKEMDPKLAKKLSTTFIPPKWENIFKTSIMSDDNIPINKRGSGVKRLILLNFFRAKAEQMSKGKGLSNIIYAIEEPETCQHPDNQRILLRALSDLSTESQVIISTHTPMLARALPDNCLRYIHILENNSRQIMIGSDKANRLFVKELGVLPDNTVKLFIGVEGPNDIIFLHNISNILHSVDNNIPDLEKMEIDGELIFFPLGGANLALWTSKLENLNRPEVHLYDRDCIPPEKPRYQKYADEVNKRENCIACITEKREIENYLHKDAILAAYKNVGIQLTIINNFGPFDDVPQKIASLVHDLSNGTGQNVWGNLTEEKKKDKESNAKRFLCSQATKYMTKDLLGEIDPNNDILGWFNKINNLIKQHT